MNSVKRMIKNKRIKAAKKIMKTNRLIKSIENTHDVSVENTTLMCLTSCIYFLKLSGKIVYVGETTCLIGRIAQHMKSKKIFDSFSFEAFNGSDKERKHKEKLLIKKFQPKYNVVHAVVKEKSY